MECLAKFLPLTACCGGNDGHKLTITLSCCRSKNQQIILKIDPGDKETLERIEKILAEFVSEKQIKKTAK